jgi:hypothetical protein
MSLKSAALLALVGMVLLSVLQIAALINTVFAVLRGLIPAVMLFRSMIYTFAALTVMVFFWVFYRRSS